VKQPPTHSAQCGQPHETESHHCGRILKSNSSQACRGATMGSGTLITSIPCISFDLTQPEQQLACFNYSNLQPLWAQDNWSKHAAIGVDGRESSFSPSRGLVQKHSRVCTPSEENRLSHDNFGMRISRKQFPRRPPRSDPQSRRNSVGACHLRHARPMWPRSTQLRKVSHLLTNHK
jgi:hypothetical protein